MNAQDSAPAACLSELGLDRWVAGELADADRHDAETHLRTCTRCAARLAAREDEKRLFQQTAPPLRARPRLAVVPAAPPSSASAETSTSATAPAVAPRRAFPRRLAGATAVVATALAAGFLLAPAIRPPPDQQTIRTKGQHHLRFFVRDGLTGTVREGTPRDGVHPGDQIRFAFDGGAPHSQRVAVLARDAGGKASVYFPDGGAQAGVLPATADGLIPYSVRLDDTLGLETLYALFCTEAVPLGPLQAALATGTPAAWPAACQLEILLLDKKPRP